MNREIEYQCQELACQSTFPLTVNFCPFCGTKQTAIKVKIISPLPDSPYIDSRQNLPTQEKVGRNVLKLQNDSLPSERRVPNSALLDEAQTKFGIYIADSISNSYCDLTTYGALSRYGKNALGLDVKRVESILSLALQRLNAVNEKELLDELEALLHVFTDVEKRLDKKSRIDALQSVCKPRSGATKGVDPEVVERHINDFCRRNGVMQRSGIWGWKVL